MFVETLCPNLASLTPIAPSQLKSVKDTKSAMLSIIWFVGIARTFLHSCITSLRGLKENFVKILQ